MHDFYKRDRLVKIPNWENQDVNIQEVINKKSVFVILPEEQTEEYITQVAKIIQACKISEDDYSIISASSGLWPILSISKLQYIVLFGAMEHRLDCNFEFPLHQITEVLDEKKVIKTLAVSELQNNLQAKNVFWNQCLKPLFLN